MPNGTFDKQPDVYRKDIIDESSLIITIEASSTSSWKKYIKNKGINIGIDRFWRKCAAKDIYNHYGLSEDKITDIIQKN